MRMIILNIFALVMLSSVAYAGSYGMQNISPFTDWESSDCSMPYTPSFFVTDTQSYNMAVDKYNSYLQQIESYLECIQHEGENDAKSIIRAIDEGISRAKDDAINDLQRVKSDLERSKMLIN